MATRQTKPAPLAEAVTEPIPAAPAAPQEPTAPEGAITGVAELGAHRVKFYVDGAGRKIVYAPESLKGKVLP